MELEDVLQKVKICMYQWNIWSRYLEKRDTNLVDDTSLN